MIAVQKTITEIMCRKRIFKFTVVKKIGYSLNFFVCIRKKFVFMLSYRRRRIEERNIQHMIFCTNIITGDFMIFIPGQKMRMKI